MCKATILVSEVSITVDTTPLAKASTFCPHLLGLNIQPPINSLKILFIPLSIDFAPSLTPPQKPILANNLASEDVTIWSYSPK